MTKQQSATSQPLDPAEILKMADEITRVVDGGHHKAYGTNPYQTTMTAGNAWWRTVADAMRAYAQSESVPTMDNMMRRNQALETALIQIRDECFSGTAHDIAEAAINAATKERESAETSETEAREPDNVGDSDRWQDLRDITGGETDCARCHGDGELVFGADRGQEGHKCGACNGTGKIASVGSEPQWARSEIAPIRFHLDEDRADELVKLIHTDDSTSPVSFDVGPGHSGEGLYAWLTEYPEEGAMFLAAPQPNAAPQGSVEIAAQAVAAPEAPAVAASSDKVERPITERWDDLPLYPMEPTPIIDKLLATEANTSWVREHQARNIERAFHRCERDLSLLRSAGGNIPAGWKLTRWPDPMIVVQHPEHGVYAASDYSHSKNIAASVLYHLADALLKAAPQAGSDPYSSAIAVEHPEKPAAVAPSHALRSEPVPADVAEEIDKCIGMVARDRHTADTAEKRLLALFAKSAMGDRDAARLNFLAEATNLSVLRDMGAMLKGEEVAKLARTMEAIYVRFEFHRRFRPTEEAFRLALDDAMAPTDRSGDANG